MENTDETRRASLLWTANSSSFFLTYDSSRAPFHILEALGPEGADTGNVSHPLCLSDRPTFCHCPPACLGRCLGFCILLQPCNKHWACTAGAGRRVSHLIHASRASAPRRRSESEGRREDGRPRGEGACPKVNPGNLLLTALLQSASGCPPDCLREPSEAHASETQSSAPALSALPSQGGGQTARGSGRTLDHTEEEARSELAGEMHRPVLQSPGDGDRLRQWHLRAQRGRLPMVPGKRRRRRRRGRALKNRPCGHPG